MKIQIPRRSFLQFLAAGIGIKLIEGNASAGDEERDTTQNIASDLSDVFDGYVRRCSYVANLADVSRLNGETGGCEVKFMKSTTYRVGDKASMHAALWALGLQFKAVVNHDARWHYQLNGTRVYSIGDTIPDKQPLRFNEMGEFIEPEIEVQVECGTAMRTNPSWISAKRQTVFSSDASPLKLEFDVLVRKIEGGDLGNFYLRYIRRFTKNDECGAKFCILTR